MPSDGKQLESLVAFVEQNLLPSGFEVKSNERVFNDEGIQVAEFDIEIHGKIGTTTISWLIECRDRPGHGAAPGSWIEQLLGRRVRFGFNKVTAVSTTGFAAGAISFAKEQGIELREVKNLDPAEFSDWLYLSSIQQIHRIADLKHATIFLDSTEAQESQEAAQEIIAGANGNDEILVSSSTGMKANITQAFLGAVESIEDAFDGVLVDQPRRLQLLSQYKDNDHFQIETRSGHVRIAQIEFFGELRVEESTIPLTKTAEYRHLESGEAISQLAGFAPQVIQGMNLAIEMHRMTETGETHIAIRRLQDDA